MPEFSADDWSRIDAVLDDVLDLEPSARAAAIARACEGRPDLRAHVERLVEADEKADAFLETPAAEYAAAIVQGDDAVASERDRTGDRIGPYRILREIGRGGMGRVYLAERADGQFEQHVALKLVGPAYSGGEVIQRFLRERQILARLEHPHIARLLDGGVADDGQPYFAMEYVDGEPITTYCDGRGLDIGARLTLFTAVCDAVQYAHQNLVVHRDLKPTNTLITADGQVKLLDFGIAKVLHEEDVETEAPLTRLGTGPMTPEYAAPEQVRGEPVTTATDVYALGALAYELLTGRRPHRLDRMTAAEVERAVTARDVERPSSAVTQRHTGDGDGAAAVARARGSDPARLRRQLRGDLDTIVLTALQKDPARRYPTAGALVDDLRRYLDGRPIAARRDSLGYRAGKFVRRHAIGVAAIAVILLSSVAGVVGIAWQARVASRQAARATEVSRFLTSLFEVSDPSRGNAASITARELLDRGASRVENDLAAQPDVQADMMLLLGRIYRQLGVYDRSQALLEKSLEVRRGMQRPDREQVASTMGEIARLRLDTGQPDEAERLQREVLALRRDVLGAEDPAVGRTLRDLAEVLSSTGKYEEAETLQRQALAIHRRAYGAEHAEVADDLEGLSTTLRSVGKVEPAIEAARQVLAMRMKVLGPEHLDTATAKNNLAIMLYERWQLPEAEQLYRDVLAFDLRRLGEVHPNTATVKNNLAFVLRDLGQFEEAEALYRSALDLDRRLFGAEHPYVATVLNNLGTVVAATGRREEAAKLFRDSIAMFTRVYGKEHFRVGAVQGALADVLRDQGDPGAEPLYREALGRLERTLPADHPRLEPVLIGLGQLLTERGDAAAAEPLLRRALRTRTARLGEGDPRTAEAQVRLGVCLAALGRHAEAEPLLAAGYARLREEPYFRADATAAWELLASK